MEFVVFALKVSPYTPLTASKKMSDRKCGNCEYYDGNLGDRGDCIYRLMKGVKIPYHEEFVLTPAYPMIPMASAAESRDTAR